MRLIYNTKLEANTSIMSKLYQGLVSDTNRFLFNNSTSTTFEIVSKVLRDYDINIASLYADLMMRPLAEIRLQGYMSENMQVTDNGVGYIVITDDILKHYGTDVASAGNMINNFNYIDEILVWVAITEDVKNEMFKVNIRSRGPVINEVAEKYNGGGHKMASGARLFNKEDIESIIKDLDKVTSEYIKENGDNNEN